MVQSRKDYKAAAELGEKGGRIQRKCIKSHMSWTNILEKKSFSFLFLPIKEEIAVEMEICITRT